MIIISADEKLIDANGWNFPVEEIDYLLAEHNGETFVLKNDRLYETIKQVKVMKRSFEETKKTLIAISVFFIASAMIIDFVTFLMEVYVG